MREIEHTIQLDTNDPRARLSLHCLYLVQHHFTFRISVVSGDFSGTAGFCLSDSQLEEFVLSLRHMHSDLVGKAQLTDCDSDGLIQFEVERNGHVSVAGQIGCSSQPQSVRFRFASDQTCLLSFIQEIDQLLGTQ
jgi:hypothetical protein